MKLFSTGHIGKLELKNRIVMAPIGNGLQDMDGGFSPQCREYYAARAKGGTAMVVASGYTTTKYEGAGAANAFDNPATFLRLEQFVEEMHSYGTKVCFQLVSGTGRVGGAYPGSEAPPAASEGPNFWNPSVTNRALTIDEIQFLTDSFVKAALMAKNAGADAVEVHSGYGGYLLDQFMTPIWNHRTDEYGGDLNGRMKFPLEIIAATKAACGTDFPIIFKLGAAHMFEQGRTIEEGQEIAKMLEKAGVSALHVDVGCYEAWYYSIPPVYEYKTNPHLEASAAIKKVVDIPVLCAGKLGNPELAKQAVDAGAMDFVVLGRSLLSDPQWANKVQENRADDVIPCIGCNEGCMNRTFGGKRIGCAVNPVTGKEMEARIKPAKTSKKVLVVGGGPGGLEAATTAAREGHKVELWEKKGELGGNLLAASGPDFKKDMKALVEYYRIQVSKLGVKVKYLMDTTAEDIIAAKPDLAIIATGANAIVPDLPGIYGKNVYTAIDVLKKKVYPSGKIVVIGGGLVGVETALHLAQYGNQVSVVEMADRILPEPVFPIDLMMLNVMINEAGLDIHTGAKLAAVENGAVMVENNGKQNRMECDAVVLAIGLKSDNGLAEQVKGKVPEVVKVGDAVEPRKILNAVWEGYNAIRALAEKD